MRFLILFMFFALGLSAQNAQPFAPYKKGGYTPHEISQMTASDSLKAEAHRKNITTIAKNDDWYDLLEGGVTLPYTIWFLENVMVKEDSWEEGEVRVASFMSDATIQYFFRESFSDRQNKIPGPELVGVLDPTALFGIKDENGNHFPVRTVISMECQNPIYDDRPQDIPAPAPGFDAEPFGGIQPAIQASEPVVGAGKARNSVVDGNKPNTTIPKDSIVTTHTNGITINVYSGHDHDHGDKDDEIIGYYAVPQHVPVFQQPFTGNGMVSVGNYYPCSACGSYPCVCYQRRTGGGQFWGTLLGSALGTTVGNIISNCGFCGRLGCYGGCRTTYINPSLNCRPLTFYSMESSGTQYIYPRCGI